MGHMVAVCPVSTAAVRQHGQCRVPSPCPQCWQTAAAMALYVTVSPSCGGVQWWHGRRAGDRVRRCRSRAAQDRSRVVDLDPGTAVGCAAAVARRSPRRTCVNAFVGTAARAAARLVAVVSAAGTPGLHAVDVVAGAGHQAADPGIGLSGTHIQSMPDSTCPPSTYWSPSRVTAPQAHRRDAIRPPPPARN